MFTGKRGREREERFAPCPICLAMTEMSDFVTPFTCNCHHVCEYCDDTLKTFDVIGHDLCPTCRAPRSGAVVLRRRRASQQPPARSFNESGGEFLGSAFSRILMKGLGSFFRKMRENSQKHYQREQRSQL
jgi:hypothetical protein